MGMSLRKMHSSLSEEQKRLLVQKELTANRTPDDLLQLLRPLAAFDSIGDQKRTKYGC